jgi:hypothetical protein
MKILLIVVVLALLFAGIDLLLGMSASHWDETRYTD